jgi:hypothetical protein
MRHEHRARSLVTLDQDPGIVEKDNANRKFAPHLGVKFSQRRLRRESDTMS